MDIHCFTFNPFSENTYLLTTDSGDCAVVDPGMSSPQEWAQFEQHISANGLTVNRVLLTHAHIDHVLGCRGLYQRYGLKPECHRDSVAVLDMCPRVSEMYGVPYELSPDPEVFFEAGEKIVLGREELAIRYVPGHAPGHVVFIDEVEGRVIAGDTLFAGGIGRTDLPGGDHDLLLDRIASELYSLPDDYVVHPGHGPATTIGQEKASNPFVRG